MTQTVQESPLIRRLIAPNPSPMTGPGTNTYLITSTGRCTVIDPGPDDTAHIDAILEAAQSDHAQIDMILVTHSHRDHYPGALELQDRTGALLAGHPSIARVNYPIEHGQEILLPGCVAEAIFTPGHASDHFCFLLKDDGSLLSGDLILGQGTVVVSPPDGNMDDYMASLRSLRDYQIERIFPGHFGRVDDPRAKIEEYINHRLEREHQILDEIAEGALTIPAIVQRLYQGLGERLMRAAEGSVLAHLISLERQGRVKRDGLTDPPRYTIT